MPELSLHPDLRFFPNAASSVASEYNWLFWTLVVVCGAVTLAIACFVIYAAVRYRRRSEDELPPQIHGNFRLEMVWTAIPLFLFMGMFGWGAVLYFDIERPPRNATQVYVIAKQWMWKIQYLDGQREINAVHVPVGEPVQLIMTSQDAIHSFFVPDFRIKQDVLPGRYTTIWFQAEKPGKYHLFCAEYCGTKHSGMIGWVYAMDRQDYQAWLRQGAAEGSLASTGEKLFHQFGCANCHHFDGHGPAPDLQGLYGRQVLLKDAAPSTADETYIRQKLMDPKLTTVLGFENIMPTFDGQLTEEQVIALISYIKALGPPSGSRLSTSSGSTPQEYGTTPGIGEPGASGNAQTEPGIR